MTDKDIVTRLRYADASIVGKPLLTYEETLDGSLKGQGARCNNVDLHFLRVTIITVGFCILALPEGLSPLLYPPAIQPRVALLFGTTLSPV